LEAKRIKQAHKEKPQFKVIEEIEKQYHNAFDRAIANSIKNAVKYLDKNG